MAVTISAVWGACFRVLSAASSAPDSTASISLRMALKASQRRSSSAFDSLSVGSTMRVPTTGQLIVGAWKP